MLEPAAPHLLFRLRSKDTAGTFTMLTEYLVRESPELWMDKEALGPWKPVTYPSADEAWAKAATLSTPTQRVHAAAKPVSQLAALRETHTHTHNHRPYDPNWRNRVPNVGGLD